MAKKTTGKAFADIERKKAATYQKQEALRPGRVQKARIEGRKRKRKARRISAGKKKTIETMSRVYSQRWETKLAQHAVAHRPFTTEQPVSGRSTAIYSMKYNPNTKVLWITFWKYKMKGKGNTYKYFKVPEKVWEDLNEASSKGRYFWYYIRGKYNYMRIR